MMGNCSRCDELPEEIPAEGILYVHARIEHTLDKLQKTFEEQNIDCTLEEEHLLKAPFTADRLQALTSALQQNLSESEREDTRVVPMSAGKEPGPGDLIGASTLADLIGQMDGKWLIDMMRDERLYNEFQPIVRSDQPDRIYGYECLLRGTDREGERVNPGHIFQTAHEADLVFQLDRRARMLAVKNAHSFDIPQPRKLFINFLPTSIYDPEYCLNTTMKAVRETGLDPERFIFEVVESEEVEDRDKLIEIMSYYREKGFHVALDDFGAGYSSLDMLTEIKPDILKLDMDLVQKIPQNTMNTDLCDQILTIASDHNIKTLAEGIETREQLSWFQDHNLDLAQGYLFSRPDVPPPKRLQELSL